MIPLVAPLLAACAPLGAPAVRVPPAVVLGLPYDEANPFAQIVRGGIAQPKVYEDARVVAFMDYSPATPGHVLIVSKTSKARNLVEISDRDIARLMRVARRIGRAAIGGLGADGFQIEQNNAFSQTVPHLHIHVMPRYLGYNRCIGSGLRQPNAVLEPIAARLRAALAADRGEAVPRRPADDIPAPAYAPATPQRGLIADAPVGPGPAPATIALCLAGGGGAPLDALLYAAGGAGPHPILLLLDGSNGDERNADLAQGARRAGWHVLALACRDGGGASDSCAGDGAAALAWLRAEAARRDADPARIVVAGHGAGGAAAARLGVGDAGIAGIILIDPAVAPAPGARPLLVIAAERGLGQGAAVADAARAAGGTVELVTMPTDHGFSDRRLALQLAIVGWLGRFAR